MIASEALVFCVHAALWLFSFLTVSGLGFIYSTRVCWAFTLCQTHGTLDYQSSVQFSHSVVSDSLQLHRLQHTRPPCPSPNSWSLLKLMSIESVMPSNHLILCHPFFLLPSIFPSIRVFSNESVLPIRWPEYWSFSFTISPSNEHPGLISFRMDWLDLFAVQGTLKSLLQHHSSKASILWCSAFFIVQLTSVHDHWENHSFDLMDLCQ